MCWLRVIGLLIWLLMLRVLLLCWDCSVMFWLVILWVVRWCSWWFCVGCMGLKGWFWWYCFCFCLCCFLLNSVLCWWVFIRCVNWWSLWLIMCWWYNCWWWFVVYRLLRIVCRLCFRLSMFGLMWWWWRILLWRWFLLMCLCLLFWVSMIRWIGLWCCR